MLHRAQEITTRLDKIEDASRQNNKISKQHARRRELLKVSDGKRMGSGRARS